MKTLSLRAALALVAAFSMTACGGSQDVDSSDSFQDEPAPEVTPDVTPEATPAPNTRPEVVEMTLSATDVKPSDVVTVDLELVDADGDAITSTLSAFLVLATGEAFDISGNLTKESESRYSFSAPITEQEIGSVYFTATAIDAHGDVSDAVDSMTLTIDNRVDLGPGPGNGRNICRIPKLGCKIGFSADDLMLNVSVPSFTDYVPDQLRGTYFDIPSTDFVTTVDLVINTNAAKWSLADSNTPSIQVTVGTDSVGSGYALEIFPVIVTGSQPTSMLIQWKWQARALASNAMTKDNLLGGSILAQGTLGAFAPTKLEASVRDGIVSFTINGNVQVPAIAATNVAGSQLGFSARAAEVAFMNASATLKP